VEYAIEAIKLGSTAIGIETKEGVVLAVEKRITSKLLVPTSVKKLAKLDEHIGCAMSGLVADARTLIDHARVESQNHWFTYNERIGVESNVQSICDLAHNFGEAEMARPFGVALLVAGWDDLGPSLYHVDPSGTHTRFSAQAIGAGSEGAQTALKEKYKPDLTLAEAKKIALDILKQVMEEKINSSNVELATVAFDASTNDHRFKFFNKEDLEQVIKTLDADLI